jgi:chaperonin GroES
MKLKPLDDRVLIRPDDSEGVTPGGIVLPDNAKEKSQRGKVLAIGPGRLLDDGRRAALTVKVGDAVLFSKYAGTELDDPEKRKLTIIRESDVLAVIA